MFDVEVTRTNGGKYTAHCRDLCLACEGETRNEALHRMQSLIFFYLSAPGDVAFVQDKPVPSDVPVKQQLLCIPPKERVQ
jgi:predicted RNase H-like HicB family nuclease